MVCRTSRGSQAIRQLLPDCRVYFLGFFCAASIGSGRVYVCAWPKIVHQQTMHIRDVRSNVRIWGMNWLLLWMVLQFTQGCVAYQSVRPLSVLTLRVVIYIFIVIQYDSECEWEFVFFLSFFFYECLYECLYITLQIVYIIQQMMKFCFRRWCTRKYNK